jgi:ribose transport system substrate-binding protein
MKKLISIILAFLVFFTMVTSLTGCTNTSNTSNVSDTTNESNTGSESLEDGAINKKIGKIGLSVHTLGMEFFMEVKKSMETLAAQDGNEIVTLSCEGDTAKQIEQIENFVTMECKYIVVFPTEFTALKDSLRAAKKNGVKILIVGTIPTEDKDCYDLAVTVDQYLLGQTAAKLAAEWIDETYPDAPDGSIEVATFGLTPSPDLKARSEALKEVEKFTKKAKVVTNFDLVGEMNQAAKSQEYAEMMLVQYPNIKCVITFSDDMSIAVDEVIMRTPSIDKSKFAIFGCGITETACKLIIKAVNNQSTLRADAALSPDAGEAYYKTITGEFKVDKDCAYVDPVFIVDASNADKYFKSK